MSKTAKPLSLEEETARAFLESHLGVPVVQHDDNSDAAMPDLRIEYPDRQAVVEVVRDIDPERAAQAKARDKGDPFLTIPSISRCWFLTMAKDADLRDIRRALPGLLQRAEAEQRTQLLPGWRGSDPLGADLVDLGIELALAGDGPAGAMLCTINSGTWDGDPDAIVRWALQVLRDNPDVAAKLASSGFPEKHVFLFASTWGNFSAVQMLMDRPHAGYPDEKFRLPDARPGLPPGVDGVWIVGARLIAWLPGGDRWIDATPGQ